MNGKEIANWTKICYNSNELVKLCKAGGFLKRTNRMSFIINCIVLFFLAVLVFVSVSHSYRLFKQSEQTFMERHMGEMAFKNATAIETSIQTHQDVLDGLEGLFEQSFSKGFQPETIIESFRPVCDEYGYKRIGFVDEDGICSTTDGYRSDLSFRDFFIKGMQGEPYISEVVEDSLGVVENINVFSTPVYRNNHIMGVLFVTYRNVVLKSKLNMEFMGKNGSVTILDNDNKIVAASELKEHVDAKENTFVNCYNRLNADKQKEVDDAIASNRTSMMKLEIDEGKYLYYMPMELSETNNWHIVSIVSQKAFDEETMALTNMLPRLFAEISFIVLLGVFIFGIKRRYYRRIELAEWERLAYIDAVTNGKNYIYFKEMLSQKILPGVIVSMDIYAFKTINSVCGIETGDRVLQKISEKIENALSKEELMGHINADRFVFYLMDTDEDVIRGRLGKLSDEISKISAEYNTPQVISCFGVCDWSSGCNIEEIYGNANMAKRLVKGGDQGYCGFFCASETERMIEEKRLTDRFDEAIQDKEFEVWYQPKINPKTERVVGAEALVRWRTKENQLISPGKFIPLFEKNGSIRELDEYMFRCVCRQQNKWKEEGKTVVPISINLSRASLYSNDLIKRYIAIAAEYGVNLKDVPIEITESAAMDEEAVKTLADLFIEAGFLLFMDDFGSGYSSLASLNNYHFDTIKIDKSLVDHIGDDSGERLLFHSITLAKELGMHITAEGVESEDQVKFLMKLSCDNIQGFYYSKPLPLEEFEQKYA